MKKTCFAVLAAVVSLVLATTAFSGGVKVPKELCLEITTEPGIVFCLSTKAGGSIKFADKQKVKYYGIDGSFNDSGAHYPLGGTGYVNGNLFRFHVSGQFSGMGTTHHSIYGFVDLSLEPATGPISVIFSDGPGGVTQENFDVEAVPCSEINAPPEPVLSIPVQAPAAQSPYSR